MSVRLEHDWFPENLPANVLVGERSWIYSSFAFLHYKSEKKCGVRVGSDSGLYAGTFFDLGPEGEVEIGNFCTLVGVIISSNSRIKIEDYAFLSHEVVLADSGIARPAPSDKKGKGIFIGANAWIGAGAVLLDGASIGEGAIVGAAAVVDFEVPSYAIIAGNPAALRGSAKKSKI